MEETQKKLRIIFTQEEKKVARRNIDNFRKSYIIDTREMILQYDYEPELKISSPMDYIIQQEIEKKLRQALNNKKSKQVIYFHYDVNSFIITNIRKFFEENSDGNIEFEFVLFDMEGVLMDIYELFDEVMP